MPSTAPPAQASLPTGPPTGQSTSTAPGPSSRAPDLSHPPGYHQNPSASELTASQRAELDRQEASESVFSRFDGVGSTPFISGTSSTSNNTSGTGYAPGPAYAPGPGGGTGYVGPNMGAKGGGGGSGNGLTGGDEGVGAMAGNAWNVAKGWMGSVAEKAEQVENEVWRRVNEK